MENTCPMDARIASIETDVERLMKVVEGNGQPGIATQVTQMVVTVGEIKKSLEDIPKKVALWVTLFLGLFALLQILGPSIRKTIGLAQTSVPQILARENPQISTIPTLWSNK